MKFSIPEPMVGSKTDRVVFSFLLLLDWLSLPALIVWGWVYAFTQDPTLTTVGDKVVAGVLITLVAGIVQAIAFGIIWWIFTRVYALICVLFMFAYERWFV